jgi:hypothetical protein
MPKYSTADGCLILTVGSCGFEELTDAAKVFGSWWRLEDDFRTLIASGLEFPEVTLPLRINQDEVRPENPAAEFAEGSKESPE